MPDSTLNLKVILTDSKTISCVSFVGSCYQACIIIFQMAVTGRLQLTLAVLKPDLLARPVATKVCFSHRDLITSHTKPRMTHLVNLLHFSRL